jgi:NADH:ubiquinone oxidoreductase subunit F (NADH-binding)
VAGGDVPFPEDAIRLRGPLTADDPDDYAGLERARQMGEAAAIAWLEASGLRGRGGAYFSVAAKWSAALKQNRPVALVVNAEEGEPGVFKDRAILCRRPARFLEGLAIAMAVLQPAVTIIFINGDARSALKSLVGQLQARSDILPSEVRVVRGAGGYVLGEETTLLNALEGRKPVPRIRPPYPVEYGLFGMPTVVNNVETVTNLSLIFRHGVEAFRLAGTPEAPGSKLLSVSGRVLRPGLYEVPMGTSLRALIDEAGGAVAGEVTAVLAGGPSGGFLPGSHLDVPLLPGLLHPTGAVTGSGGMIILDESSDLRQAALEMAAFNAQESCGKCTPCREGAPRVLDAVTAGARGHLTDVLDALQFASLCGLGQMAPGPIRSALTFWPELFE